VIVGFLALWLEEGAGDVAKEDRVSMIRVMESKEEREGLDGQQEE
jgi:hypothetical protein